MYENNTIQAPRNACCYYYSDKNNTYYFGKYYFHVTEQDSVLDV